MSSDPNSAPFIKRFLTYQKERFPFLVHGLLIAAFTFSAVSYSRICRGEDGFIPTSDFIIGVFAAISLFFLVRIFDEFKDKEDDEKYRKYLPVPRGLISLKELKIIGWIVGLTQVAVIAIFQFEMLYLYAIVLAYLCLMGVEFFVPAWLKKRQILYITSHMFIIPLIDIYSSGLDWLLDGGHAHWGLAWFFAVSYFNGLMLEFGRKIRTPESEEEGVISYTGLYGTKGGVVIWLLLLALTLGLAIGASHYAGFGMIAYIILISFFVVCAIPGIIFIQKPTIKRSKFIEYASGLWTALMYLALGGIPMLKALLS
jgi:4-hydroxybenzoate polyprenyltransferase